MKKRYLIFLLNLSVFSNFYSQEIPTRVIEPSNCREGETVEYCTTHKKMQELLSDPSQKSKQLEYALLQEQALQKIKSGGIEKGETPERAILRELEEEAGVVVDPEYKIEFMKPLFISKGNASKYYPCIIQLTERQYHEVVAKGDGTEAEKKSQSVKIDVKYLNSINASDLITEYMILKLKDYLNMQ